MAGEEEPLMLQDSSIPNLVQKLDMKMAAGWVVMLLRSSFLLNDLLLIAFEGGTLDYSGNGSIQVSSYRYHFCFRSDQSSDLFSPYMKMIS